MKRFDILIIGAGAVGNAIAREITKNNAAANVGILEKEPDTAFGISGRNSGVLHAGFNNRAGSLMAKLCVQGSEGFEKEAGELGISFKRTGKLVIARHEEDLPKLDKLKEQGETNGTRGLKIIDRTDFQKHNYDGIGIAALWSGMTGIFDPFEYTIALAETSAANGTSYYFGRQVTAIETAEADQGMRPDGKNGEERFIVTARNRKNGETEQFASQFLINSAGLYSDEICRMAGIHDYRIYPCRGEYHILDKKLSGSLELPVYPVPNEKEGGLGVHLTPTIHGNIMIGPSAEYFSEGQEREDYGTSREVMDVLIREGAELFPGIQSKDCIRSFAGVRPKLTSKTQGGYSDFVIGESEKVPGLIELVGIESPGLTSSIPIAKMVYSILKDRIPHNTGTHKEVQDRLKQRKGSQKMICLCESITEETVLEAYDKILKIGAIPTIKGIKNRARVTMGSCQGSFCTTQIIELLAKKRDLDPFELTWNGFESHLFTGRVRE